MKKTKQEIYDEKIATANTRLLNALMQTPHSTPEARTSAYKEHNETINAARKAYEKASAEKKKR